MNIAIILAGGSGTRMGNMNEPKQFAEVFGKPIIVHTLEKFDLHPEIDQIIIGCKEDYIDDVKIMVRKYSLDKVKKIVSAGGTRQETVFKCLTALKEAVENDDIVIIHDSVRPLISTRIISDNISAAKEHQAVDTVIPASDTIVRSTDSIHIEEIPKRAEFYQGQTPQSFQYKLIVDAHSYCLENHIKNATDDCQLVMKYGQKVALVIGDQFNFKITNQDDLVLLKALIKLGSLERL